MHIHNASTVDETAEATITEHSFKAEFVLEDLKNIGQDTLTQKTYLNVRYEINEDGYNSLNLLPTTNGDYSVGQVYRYANKEWTLKADNTRTYLDWADITNEKIHISKVEIADKDGVATLVIEGTYAGDYEASTIKLKLDKNKGTADARWAENKIAEAGQFKFELAIADLLTSETTDSPNENGYFLRLYRGETTKIDDINSKWASDKLFEKVEIGDSVFYFFRNNLTQYYTLGVVRFEKSTLEG